MSLAPSSILVLVFPGGAAFFCSGAVMLVTSFPMISSMPDSLLRSGLPQDLMLERARFLCLSLQADFPSVKTGAGSQRLPVQAY